MSLRCGKGQKAAEVVKIETCIRTYIHENGSSSDIEAVINATKKEKKKRRDEIEGCEKYYIDDIKQKFRKSYSPQPQVEAINGVLRNIMRAHLEAHLETLYQSFYES